MTPLRVSAATDAEVAGDIAPSSRPCRSPWWARNQGNGANWSPFTAVRAGRSERRMSSPQGPGAADRPSDAGLDEPGSRRSFVPVVVDYRFAGNRALAAAAMAFDGWPAGAMIEVAAVVPDASSLDETLVDQLATLRRLGQPAVELHRLTWNGSGYYLRGSTNAGSPVLVSAHVSCGRSAVSAGSRACRRLRGRADPAGPRYRATRGAGQHHLNRGHHDPDHLGDLPSRGMAPPSRRRQRRTAD